MIGELKKTIINCEYYEEEFVESFLETTMEDMEKEAERQRYEKESQEWRIQREKERKEVLMRMKSFEYGGQQCGTKVCIYL